MQYYLMIAFLWVAGATNACASDTLFRENGTEIRYYLDNSRGDNLLVIFHGSDCNSVTHMSSVQTIWQGIAPDAALLTIEKYGIDASLRYATGEQPHCPTAYLENNTIEQRIDDGVHVVQTLMDSYQRIMLVGGSEGGSIALGVAAKIQEVHAVLVLNAGSSSFQHDVEYSIIRSVPEEEKKLVLQEFRQFAAQILESEAPFPVEVSGHGYGFWKDILTRDLLSPLNQISAPVLIMQSTADESVDPLKAQQQIESLISAGADNIQLVMLHGLDHSFRDASGRSKLGDVLEQASRILASFRKQD